MGVPTNGSLVMTGYHGYVVRAVSDQGRVIRINTGYQNGVAGAIAGGLSQRWEDPTASGNSWGEDFILRSAGPNAANNTTSSDFNFDSHFTFNEADVLLEPLSVGPYESLPTATTYEDVMGLGFVRQNSGIPGVPDNYMPIPSSPTVAYGVAVYPQSGIGQLYASFRINESARSNDFAFAYVVTNSGFDVYGVISVETGLNQAAILHVTVPEPALMLSFAFITYLAGRNRYGIGIAGKTRLFDRFH